MSKKIIITGGAGFIGFHLAKKLIKKKYQVIIWDNLSRGKIDKEFLEILKNKNIIFEKKDLTKKINSKHKNIKIIFHLAGTVGVKNVTDKPYFSFYNNILTLKNLLDFDKKLKKKFKLILFSTSEVYSPLIKKKRVKFPIKETNDILIENIIIPRDSYYLSKIFNEKILQLGKKEYLILRPHNIYGPRMGYSHVIPEIIKKLCSQKKIKVFSSFHKRAFCFIDDAINQILSLSFKKKHKNKIYNIGNMKEEINIFSLANKIKRIIKSESILVRGPITKGSPIRRVPDMIKTNMKTKINYFTKLDKGLETTIKWYLKDLKK